MFSLDSSIWFVFFGGVFPNSWGLLSYGSLQRFEICFWFPFSESSSSRVMAVFLPQTRIFLLTHKRTWRRAGVSPCPSPPRDGSRHGQNWVSNRIEEPLAMSHRWRLLLPSPHLCFHCPINTARDGTAKHRRAAQLQVSVRRRWQSLPWSPRSPSLPSFPSSANDSNVLLTGDALLRCRHLRHATWLQPRPLRRRPPRLPVLHTRPWRQLHPLAHRLRPSRHHQLPRRLHRVALPVPPRGQRGEVRGSAPTRWRGDHLRPRSVVDPGLRLRRRPRPRRVDARPSCGEERAVLVGDALRERQAGDQGLQPPHEGWLQPGPREGLGRRHLAVGDGGPRPPLLPPAWSQRAARRREWLLLQELVEQQQRLEHRRLCASSSDQWTSCCLWTNGVVDHFLRNHHLLLIPRASHPSLPPTHTPPSPPDLLLEAETAACSGLLIMLRRACTWHNNFPRNKMMHE